MKPRIVLVGAGKFGTNHLRNLVALDKKKIIQLVGVVDTDDNILSDIKKEYSIQTSMNYRYFVELADAFDIVTPASTHYQFAKFFLNNNKHVFVEKPLALSSKHATELVCLAKKKRKVLQVGHIFRYNSAVDILRKLVMKEENFPYYITGKFLQSTKPKSDVGAIFNYLHHFDILDNLFGLGHGKVFAHSNLHTNDAKWESNVVVFLQLAKKINATIHVGWIPTGKYRTLDLYSKKCHIICDLEKQKIEIHEHGKIKCRISPKHKEPLLLELIDFVRCIKGNAKPKADGIIGARIVKIAETATQSLEKNVMLNFSD
jgi:predicted dehydrogenase